MLREIPKVKQIPGDLMRRWFVDEDMDLFVWLDSEEVFSSFQLSYDKPSARKALTCKRDSGFEHMRVDDGARRGHHPGSPLLVVDGNIDKSRVFSDFLGKAENIDDSVVKLGQSHLMELRRRQQKRLARARSHAGDGVLKKVIKWLFPRNEGDKS